MKVVIVNGFETFDERMNLVSQYFSGRNHEIVHIRSNFGHMKKEYLEETGSKTIYVDTKPYYRNLSIRRLNSHYNFAKEAINIAENLKPDLMYIIIPSNSLVHFSAILKKKSSNIKIIYDVMDLWPESLPIKGVKNFPPIMKWRNLRDNNLHYSDYIITECNLFKTQIEEKLIRKNKSIKNIKTIYLAKQDINVDRKVSLSESTLNLAYLGSINNIIDIPKITEILLSLKKETPVKLHIIGDGEKKDEFIDAAKKIGIEVKYYGKIYDSKIKQEIFDICHYGLNIMKKTVSVGLTMKSVDYFQHGLPIINNIPFDTERIVDKYNVGLNVLKDEDLMKINDAILLSLEKRTNIDEVFSKKFSIERFNSNLDEVMDVVGS